MVAENKPTAVDEAPAVTVPNPTRTSTAEGAPAVPTADNGRHRRHGHHHHHFEGCRPWSHGPRQGRQSKSPDAAAMPAEADGPAAPAGAPCRGRGHRHGPWGPGYHHHHDGGRAPRSRSPSPAGHKHCAAAPSSGHRRMHPFWTMRHQDRHLGGVPMMGGCHPRHQAWFGPRSYSRSPSRGDSPAGRGAGHPHLHHGHGMMMAPPFWAGYRMGLRHGGHPHHLHHHHGMQMPFGPMGKPFRCRSGDSRRSDSLDGERRNHHHHMRHHGRRHRHEHHACGPCRHPAGDAPAPREGDIPRWFAHRYGPN